MIWLAQAVEGVAVVTSAAVPQTGIASVDHMVAVIVGVITALSALLPVLQSMRKQVRAMIEAVEVAGPEAKKAAKKLADEEGVGPALAKNVKKTTMHMDVEAMRKRLEEEGA